MIYGSTQSHDWPGVKPRYRNYYFCPLPKSSNTVSAVKLRSMFSSG